MRIFPLLAAIAVSALMYMAIFERNALLGLAQGAAQPPAPAVDADGTEPTSPSDVAEPARVKVVVQRSAAAPLASAVIVRGQTTAARQVAVKAETSAVVVSAPLRKGATVNAGDVLCELDPGTRGAQQKEAQARRDEAQSRVPEAQARVA